MTITKKSYEDLGPYWDFQRKKEYNKERLRHLTEEMTGKIYNQFGMMSAEELFDSLWVKLPEEAYEEPQVGWVPEDTTYRFEWEKEPGPKQIEHMKTANFLLYRKIDQLEKLITSVVDVLTKLTEELEEDNE